MNLHDKLDHIKLLFAQKILETIDITTIRRVSLSNLDRWNTGGVWCSAHDEWRELMMNGEDQEIVAAMSSTDQRSNRLRQSPPYTGLLDEHTRKSLIAITS